MHVRGRGDHEVESPTARLAAAADDGCREPTPFTRDLGIDGQWIEGRFDDAEPL